MSGAVFAEVGIRLPHRFLHEQGLAHVCDDGQVWTAPIEQELHDALRDALLRKADEFES